MSIKPLRQRPIFIEALEPRLLFSATSDIAVFDDGSAYFHLLGDNSTSVDLTQIYTAPAANPIFDSHDAAVPLMAAAEPLSTSLTHVLVVVDTSVKDYQQLVDDIREHSSGKTLDIVYIDKDHNGVDAITQLLSQYTNVDSLHIISHGETGAVTLGNAKLDIGNIGQYAEQFTSWRTHFTAEADILFYGCSIAETEAGRQFIQTLGDLTQTDVAASKDLTGSAALGGDWDLEYRYGAIETDGLFSLAVQKAYNSLLADVTHINYTTRDASSFVSNSQFVGQTFAYTSNSASGFYAVEQIGLYLYRDVSAAAQTITVTLSTTWNGVGAQILGTGTIASSSIATSPTGTLTLFNFSTGASLADGATYFIQITSSGSDGQVYARNDSSAGYTDGTYVLNNGTLDNTRDLAFSITNLGAVNTPPVVDPDFQITDKTTAANVAFSYTFPTTTFVDLDGDTLSYTAQTGAGTALPSWLTFNGGTRTFSGTPLTGDVGTTLYKVIANDGNGGTVEEYFNITVTPNNAPVLGADTTANVAENSTAVATYAATDADGDAITYSLSGSDAALFSINSSGVVSFTSARNFEVPTDVGTNNVYNIIVTATDSKGAADTQAVAVTVTNVNEAPVLSADASLSIAENTTAVGTYAATDVDAGDTRTYSLSGADAALFSVNSSGVVTFNSGRNFELPTDVGTNNVYNITITATDAGGLTDTQTVAVTITNANEAPVLGADTTANVAENTTAVGTYAATDVDSGDTRTYSLSGADAALFSINSSGVVSFNSARNFESPADVGANNVYDIIVTATDAGGLTDTQAVAITITNANEAPALGADASLSVAENTTAVGTYAATDVDAGDTRTYSLSGADAALFSVNSSGVVTFNSGSNFESPTDVGTNNVYNITITATDAGGLTDTQTVAVTITNANEAPVLGADTTANVAENTTAVGTYAATDVDSGDTRTYSLSGADAALFSINSSGVVSFNSARNFESPADVGANNVYDIIVTATDAGGLTDTQAVAITITNANEAPVLGADASVNVAENTTAVGTYAATDVDAGDTRTYSLSGADAALFSVNASGVVSFNTARNFESPADVGGNNVYDIIVTATDAGGLTDTQALAITITNANEAPVLGADTTANVAENTTAVGTYAATDVDVGDTRTYSLSGADAALFSINSSGVVSFNSARNFESPADVGANNVYDIIVTATDAGGLTDTQAVAITITNANEAPVLGADASVNVAENTTAVGTYAATDVDAGDTRTYSLSGADAALFSINSSGVVTFNSGRSFESPADVGANNVYDIIVTATDAGGLTDTQAVAITITNANEAPVLGADTSANVAENTTAVGTYAATDVDAGDARTYSLSGADAALFSINSSGVVSFNTARNFESPADVGANNVYDIIVTATDAGGLTDTQAVAITITNVNEAPVLGADASVNVAENNTAAGTYAATDVDAGDTRTYSLLGADAAQFSISPSGVVTFNVAPNTASPTDVGGNNVYDIIIQVTDAGGLTDTQAVAITITNVNEAPVLGADTSVNVAENTTAVGTFSATDVDVGDTRTYSLSGADAAEFTINPTTGAVSFNLPPNTAAPTDVGGNNVYNIIVTAMDAGGLTDTQAIDITVINANEAPVLGLDTTATLAENSTAVGTYAATDVDIGDTITYSLSGADAALFSVNASGVVTFNTAPNYENALDVGANNIYNIIVTATDVGGLSDTQALAITVTNTNEAPVLAADTTVNVAENTTAVGTYAATDVDASDTRTYSLSGADAALFSINTSGVVSFNGAPDLENPLDAGANNVYDIIITATDTGGLTDTQTLAITVTNANEAPVLGADTTANVAENTTAVGTYAATDVDAGDTRTYSLSGADAALFSVNATGVVSFNTAPNYENALDVGTNNIYNIIVTATDAGGLTDTQAVAITVTNANEAPALGADTTANVAENTTAVGTYAATDVDAGDTRTYSLSGADAALFSINSSGVVSFNGAPDLENALDAGANNVYDIIITATDSGGLSDTQALAITVTNANESPVLGADTTANVAENTTAVGTYAATDVDAGDTRTYSLSGADAALFSINASGVVSFNTAPNYENALDVGANNIYNIIVTATDAGGLTDTQAVAITVTNANEAPVLGVDTTANVAENTTAVGTYAATDVDAGDTRTYSLSGADAALFSINSSGVVSFNGAPDLENPLDTGANNVYDIIITATDSGGLSDTQALAITVTNANEAPVLGADITANVAENTTAVGTYAATDVDAGDTRTYSLSGADAALFSVNASGVVTFNTAPNYENALDVGANNIYNIIVTATDAGGLTDTQAVAITVTNINEAPILGADTSLNVSQNTTAAGTYAATDIDAGDIRTYSLSGVDAAIFNINATTGAVSFITAPTVASPADVGGDNVYNIIVTATDTGGLNDTQAVAITVTNTNNSPVLGADTTANVAENSTAVGTYAATDPDIGDTQTYSLSGVDSAFFSINASGVVSFNTAPNFEAAADAGANNIYNIIVTTTDAGGLSDTQAVAITVTNANEAPVLGADTAINLAQNTTLVGVYSASDVDIGDTTTYSLSGADAAEFTINALSGEVSFKVPPTTANPTDVGSDNTYNIIVTATDAAGLNDTQSLAISVFSTNSAPVLGADSIINLSENTAAVGSFAALDPDAGDIISYSLSGSDAGLFTINSTTGALNFQAAPNFEAPSDLGKDNIYNLIITATDSGGLSDSQALSINLTNVNEAPLLAADTSISIAENTSAVATYTATDVDSGDTLSYSLSGADASLFNINSTTGAVSFKAAPNFENPLDQGADNTYNLVVTATDLGGLTDTQAVAISVTNVNEPTQLANPIADQQATEDSAFSFHIPSNTFVMQDAKTISYSAQQTNGAALPSWLSFDAATGTFSGTPSNDDVGTVSISVNATDNLGIVVSDTFVLSTANTNDAPSVLNPLSDKMMLAGTLFNFTLPSNTFIDVDQGDQLTISVGLNNGQPLPQWLTYDSNTHTFKGVPSSADVGNLLIVIRATDLQGSSVATTFSLTVIADTVKVPVVEVPTDGSTPIIKPQVPSDEIKVDVDSKTKDEPKVDIKTPNDSENLFLDTSGNTPLVGDDDSLDAQNDNKRSLKELLLRDVKPTDLKSLSTSSTLANLISPDVGFNNDSLDEFNNELRRVRQQMDEVLSEEEQQRLAIAGVTVSLTTGILIWSLRASSLLFTLVSMLPLWRGLDPLPILADIDKRKKELEQQQKDKKKEDATAKEIGYLFDNTQTKKNGKHR